MSLNWTVYYAEIINFIGDHFDKNKELTRSALEKFIVKTLKVKAPRKIVYKLKELGYIEEYIVPQKRIIKFIKEEK